ncbi:MAG: hypothetical protein ACPHQ9_12615 [Marinobacter sp.]|uniref:hypothetical protein n=1 Tax=Marinobacter sp. TaxID=50741 RepID=UPI003C4BF66A
MSNEAAINSTIDRDQKTRKPDFPSDLDSVKKRIFVARGVEFPDVQSVESIERDLASSEFTALASKIAEHFLNGSKILLLGKASSEIILSLTCFQRGVHLLSQAMRRTRDVVDTSRGDLGSWRSEPEVKAVTGSFEVTGRAGIHDMIESFSPDLVVLLNPPKGAAANVREYIDSRGGGIDLAAVSAISNCVEDLPGCIAVAPVPKAEMGAWQKHYTVCCVLHFLLLRVRDEIATAITSHPRSQALVAQLHSAGLDTNAALVGLSIVLDDMPLSPTMRFLVRTGLEQINKGWSLPLRTGHSRGLLSYGLRSLLTECGANYPFTSKEMALRLSPLFRVMAQTGDCETLIDCLLTNDRKTAKDKSAKAAMLAAQSDVRHPRAMSIHAPVMTETDGESKESYESRFHLHVERNDSLSATLLPLVAEQNCIQYPGVYMLVSSNAEKGGRVLCQMRSQSIHLGDAMINLSFESDFIEHQPEWNADTRFASLEIEKSGVDGFEAALRRYLEQAQIKFSDRSPLNADDGPLARSYRVFPLAHWLERQPWGKGFKEPVFSQDFIVRKVLTHMDAHQHIVVDDAHEGIPNGEGFLLVWRHSVNGNVPSLVEGQTINVRYRLLVDREKTSNDIFGLVDTLRKVSL